MNARRRAALLALTLCATAPVASADLPAVRTLDLSTLPAMSPTALADRRELYDRLVAIACLQGLVNRTSPDLYLYFAASRYDASLNADRYWFDRIRNDAAIGHGLLDGRAVTPLADLDAALDAFSDRVHGLVVWDENVPATVNAAFIAAGADDLIAVRWDASPTSLFARLQARGLAVRTWLVGRDGSAIFHDNGAATTLVPGTTRTTSRSAKVDAYRWAEEIYQRPGHLDPTEFGYMVDASWVLHPEDGMGSHRAINALDLANRDLIVARRGFAYDLSPWTDVVATDAPGTPVGIDAVALREILANARAQAGASDVITIRGFVPWQTKYSSYSGLASDHSPVGSEWHSAQLVSPYGAGLDAGGGMANGSFFQYVQSPEVPPSQRRPTPEDLVGAGFLTGLASNGGFEDGASGWTFETTHAVVYTDDATTGARAHTGLRYLECNVVGSDGNSIYRDGPAVPAGTVVTLRAFVRAPGATPVHGRAVVFGVGGTAESTAQDFTATSAWSEVRVRTTMRNGGHASTRAQINLEDPGVNLDVDDVAFYQGDAAAGQVEPAHYMLWFNGDYDSAAWMYAYALNIWNAPGRGIVPMAWPFGGAAIGRFPVFYNHVLATRTPRDFFVGADSGPAYGNPGVMEGASRAAWRDAGMRAARRLDSAAGWLLDGLDSVDTAHLTGVTPFFGDGIMLTTPNAAALDGTVVDHAPLVSMLSVGSPAEDFILAHSSDAPTTATFTALRTAQGTFSAPPQDNVTLVGITHDLVVAHAAQRYRFVDPFTFFELARRRFGGTNDHRASFDDVAPGPVVVGRPVTVSVTVRNDGWETWHSTAASPYRVGFDVADAPQTTRAARPYTVRVALPADVAPGESVHVTATLPALPDARPRSVQIDVVQEGVTWFETQGDIPAQFTLRAQTAGADGGVVADGSVAADGSVIAEDGVSGDGSARADAATDGRAGLDGGTGQPGAGCGCRTAHTASRGAWVAWLMAGALARRRRARG